MKNKREVLSLSVLCSAVLGTSDFAADFAGEPGRSSGKKNPLNNVYLGEQHLHTVNSPDSFAMGTPATPRTTLIASPGIFSPPQA